MAVAHLLSAEWVVDLSLLVVGCQEVDCEVTGCNIILNWKPPSNLVRGVGDMHA